MRLAVFASGNGSNFQVLIDEQKKGNASYKIVLLVCDRKNAKVIERATNAGVPVFLFNAKEFPSKESYERVILTQLREYQVEGIILAGYLRIVGSTLLNAYEGKIMNLHPSLLPAFPGLTAIADAYHYGVKISGVTVHFVDEGLDTGPIIAQEAVPLEPSDTLESFANRIHEAEHRLLPKIVNRFAQGKIGVDGRKITQ